MIRISTIFLCILLAAAAVGRYRAEAAVKEARQELERLDMEDVEQRRAIQMLRAEIAYLENPERLARIAEAKTDLRPSQGAQTLSAGQFAAVFGVDDALSEPDAGDPGAHAVILHALAMSQLGRVE